MMAINLMAIKQNSFVITKLWHCKINSRLIDKEKVELHLQGCANIQG